MKDFIFENLMRTLDEEELTDRQKKLIGKKISRTAENEFRTCVKGEHISKAQSILISEMLNQGFSLAETARKCKVSRSTVVYHKKKIKKKERNE